jgi:hypothetical protein
MLTLGWIDLACKLLTLNPYGFKKDSMGAFAVGRSWMNLPEIF